MKLTVGVYDSPDKALKAMEALIKDGFPVKQLSFITQVEVSEEDVRLKSRERIGETGARIGIIAGPILGFLTGLGIFAIPGLGFLFGAGALVGAIAGFDFGLVGGGIVSLLISLGIEREHAEKMHEHLQKGKFFVIAQGTHDEVFRARNFLDVHGQHQHLH